MTVSRLKYIGYFMLLVSLSCAGLMRWEGRAFPLPAPATAAPEEVSAFRRGPVSDHLKAPVSGKIDSPRSFSAAPHPTEERCDPYRKMVFRIKIALFFCFAIVVSTSFFLALKPR